MRRVAEAEVTVPNGSWWGGACHREARVRSIEEGEDLEAELNPALLPIEQTTAVLARCVTQLAGRDCAGADAFRDLSMGDREALLLHVRRMTFGERIDCLLSCPACAERMDFQLDSKGLIVSAAEPPQHQYDEEFLLEGIRFRVKFRVPTGGDVETSVRSAGCVPDAAVRALVIRCVEWVHRQTEQGEGDVAVPAAEWPASLVAQLSTRMAELDPQAEIKLQLECPMCGHEFAAFFDTSDFFFRELREREQRLYEEVHQLALSYHWSEADILRMTPRKRKLYLDLLAGGGIHE